MTRDQYCRVCGAYIRGGLRVHWWCRLLEVKAIRGSN